MEVREKSIMKAIQYIFRILFVASFVFLIMGELLLPREGEEKGTVQTFEAEWVRVMSNGSRVPIEVPGDVEAEAGELVVIETTLPEDMPVQTWFCFRSSQQDVNVYIDGELRQSYQTEETRPFGNTSMSAFIFLKTGSEDNGKRLTVELQSESFYTGVLNAVYYGDRLDIWKSFAGEYGMGVLLAFCLLILAVLTIMFSSILRVGYHKEILIGHLGTGIFLAAAWLIAESRLRQLFFPNISVIGNIAFLVLMLLPLPFIFYMNGIQKNRYQKWYMAMCFVYLLNFVYCVVMQLLGKKNFLDTMTMTNILIVAGVVLASILIYWDCHVRQHTDYTTVATGLIGLMVSGVVEIIMVYQKMHSMTGVPLSIGLMFLLLTAALKTGQDIALIEKEKQRAVNANVSKASFLANMSHEIRTPINSVIGMNEMILRENKDAAIQEYAENIQSASRVLLGLVDDVLDFSKMEEGNLQIVEAPYDTAVLLAEVVHILKERAEAKNLNVVLQIAEDLPTQLKGDESRMRQIMTNLLSNAVKYTNEGTITLTVQKAYGTAAKFALRISVADTGEGIRQEDMDKLFDSFTRLEVSKNISVEGTGLGLNLVKKLLDEMNGEIQVQSVYGKGSLFTVTVPQECLDHTPIGDWRQASRKKAEQQKVCTGRLRAPEASVLAVDDNAMNLSVIKGLLKRTQIQLDLAGSGNECLQLCQEKRYDLILMDHMMPEPNGVQTLQLLKEDNSGFNAQTPVLVLTANAISGIREEYIKEGFVDYLSKPVTVAALEEMIIKYLPEQLVTFEEVQDESAQPENVSEEQSGDMEEPCQPENAKQVSGSLIDEKLGLSYCADDEEMYREILQVYYSQGQEYREKLKTYYETKDWEQFGIVAHAIKSTSLGIGAAAFSEFAKQQEFAGKEKKEAFILESREQFEERYEQVLEAVHQILGDVQQENEEKREVSLEEYIVACEELQEKIASFEMNEALKQMELLQTLQCPLEQADEVLSQIRAGVEEFDYDTAENCLQEWMDKLRAIKE